MKLKITFGLFLFAFLVSAQSARMNRDIEVAEKILETLVEEQMATESTNDHFAWGNRTKVTGNYVEGFGAMFTIPSSSLKNSIIVSGLKTKTRWDNGQIVVEMDNNDDESNQITPSKTEEELKDAFKEIAEIFFCDYSYLLRQLSANDKIMIRYGGNANTQDDWDNFFVLAHSDQRNYSATITKAAIDDFQTGSLQKAAFIKRIEFIFEEAKDRKEKYKDLDLLATVINKVFQRDSEGDLYVNGTPIYERIDGIGAIYNLRVRSGKDGFPRSFRFGNSTRTIWGPSGLMQVQEADESAAEAAERAKLEAIEKEQRDTNLDEYYNDFLKELKVSIIEYGSIVKSLKAGETIRFRLSLPKCKKCKLMPKKVEITAKESTLKAYLKDEISLEKAVNQLIIK